MARTNASKPSSSDGFKPAHELTELAAYNQRTFDELRAKYTASQANDAALLAATAPLVPTSDGWVKITPAIAEALILRNGGNRAVKLTDVIKLGRQMKAGQWRRTGESISLSTEGLLLNGQHRNWAILLTGETAEIYVVTGIDGSDNMFAFFDTGKTRTAATALQIAGHDGTSATLARVLKLADDIDNDVYTVGHKKRSVGAASLTNYEYLTLLGNYPGAEDAVKSTLGEFADVLKFIGGEQRRKDFLCWFVMKVTDLFGLDAAEAFFDALMDDSPKAPDDPTGKFRVMVEKDRREPQPMQAQTLASNMIRAFNAWRLGIPAKGRWFAGGHEPFPEFDMTSPVADAAE